MKTLFMALLVLGFATSAQAEMCKGGQWHDISTRNYQEVISTTHYGRSTTGVIIHEDGGWLTLGNVGTKDRKLEYISAPFDLVDLDLLTGIRAMVNLPEEIRVSSYERIEENKVYDDCFDIPAHSRKKLIYTEFIMEIPGVGSIHMGSREETNTPPAKN